MPATAHLSVESRPCIQLSRIGGAGAVRCHFRNAGIREGILARPIGYTGKKFKGNLLEN